MLDLSVTILPSGLFTLRRAHSCRDGRPLSRRHRHRRRCRPCAELERSHDRTRVVRRTEARRGTPSPLALAGMRPTNEQRARCLAWRVGDSGSRRGTRIDARARCDAVPDPAAPDGCPESGSLRARQQYYATPRQVGGRVATDTAFCLRRAICRLVRGAARKTTRLLLAVLNPQDLLVYAQPIVSAIVRTGLYTRERTYGVPTANYVLVFRNKEKRVTVSSFLCVEFCLYYNHS